MTSRVVIGSLEPRGLSREVGAAYCGLTPEGFDQWVKRGILPGPIPGTQRWDRKAIDLALDRASGLQLPQDDLTRSPYDQWKKRREDRDPREVNTVHKWLTSGERVTHYCHWPPLPGG